MTPASDKGGKKMKLMNIIICILVLSFSGCVSIIGIGSNMETRCK